MPANRLLLEKNPYLQQHAHNPVDWFPWGDEAFAKARAENKLIFLSIGYSTCHWCHVMAHESFEDPDIAEYLNMHFISIKVDREERPDLDQIYMSAVTAITGQGGWPLSVFLTADAKPFFGGTYFPPYAKWGSPGFKDLLISIHETWDSNRDNVLESAAKIMKFLRDHSKTSRQEDILDRSIFDKALEHMSRQFDHNNGGFSSSPKFPMGHVLSMLLRLFELKKNPQALSMVERSLDAMAHGGIYDHLGGGFHRYSTDERWHVPHFEKMLYDQAILIMAYAEAYQATGKLLYASTLRETIDYVLREMTSLEGGFFSAQDADTHGHEGAYYVFSYDEIVHILGKDHAEPFCLAYGVLKDGNVLNDPHAEFLGKNVLFFKQGDRDVFAQQRQALLEVRLRRERPHLDHKILTDWNGLMIAALSFAGAVLGEQKYENAAQRCADFMLNKMSVEGKRKHCYCEGSLSVEAMLDDDVFLAYGCLHLYETCFDHKYLHHAEHLIDEVIQNFMDNIQGDFFMTRDNPANLVLRPKNTYDGAYPCGNSVFGNVAMRLYYITAKEHFKDAAQGMFKALYRQAENSPSSFGFYLGALDLLLNPTQEIKIQGSDPGQTQVAKFKNVVYKHFMPRKVLIRDADAHNLSVSVCSAKVCQLPVQKSEELERLIVEFKENSL